MKTYINKKKYRIIIGIITLDINFNLNLNQIKTYFSLGYNIIEENKILFSSLYFTSIPSSRLKIFLIKNNFNNPIYMLEFNPINILRLPVKKTLNSIAGTYICINLINDKTYVGSGSINCMYRRYTGHLLKGIGGNLLVKLAV